MGEMNTNKVCGEFPDYCYKAFECKEYAESFMDRGTFRMGCQLSYKAIENEQLRDATEGSVSIRVPGIVTYYGFSPGRAEEPICLQKMGHREESGGSSNPRFCFCTFLPKVNRDHMKTLGKYIVNINNPRKLAEDINNYFANKEEGKFVIEGMDIVYNKGQESDRQLTNNEKADLAYKQKPESFSPDCEFRIVAIKLGEVCTRECKFIDKYFDEKFEPVEPVPDCKFIEVNLGKPLDYLSFVTLE
jgi:hypothetical protein